MDGFLTDPVGKEFWDPYLTTPDDRLDDLLKVICLQVLRGVTFYIPLLVGQNGPFRICEHKPTLEGCLRPKHADIRRYVFCEKCDSMRNTYQNNGMKER